MQFDKNVPVLLALLFALILFSGCTADTDIISGNFLGSIFENGENSISASAVNVYFCPEDNCSVQLIREIDSANETVETLLNM